MVFSECISCFPVVFVTVSSGHSADIFSLNWLSKHICEMSYYQINYYCCQWCAKHCTNCFVNLSLSHSLSLALCLYIYIYVYIQTSNLNSFLYCPFTKISQWFCDWIKKIFVKVTQIIQFTRKFTFKNFNWGFNYFFTRPEKQL